MNELFITAMLFGAAIIITPIVINWPKISSFIKAFIRWHSNK